MSLIKRMRKQYAVWWARTTADAYGRFAFANPVEIRCRWEDRVVEFLSPQGERELSASLVYVDREMSVGDMLKEGNLESSMTTDPSQETGVGEIRRFEKLPNLRNTETLLTAYTSPRLWQ